MWHFSTPRAMHAGMQAQCSLNANRRVWQTLTLALTLHLAIDATLTHRGKESSITHYPILPYLTLPSLPFSRLSIGLIA